MVTKLENIPKPPASKNKRASTTPPPPAKAAKKFEIKKWDGSGTGEKIIVYADSGMGKTTLCTMAPKPVFIGLDDGGRKIKHPHTGENLDAVPGVETFDDVRAVLQQPELFDAYETIVVDTATILEEWAIPYVLENIPNDKGLKMSNIIKYGYNKGYRHLYDTMKLILGDCDTLVRGGKNIILIAQSAPNKVPNTAGEDYLREGPRLTSQNGANIEAMYCEWADHIFRIGYRFIDVSDKKAQSDQDRAIFVDGQAYFRAKSRTIDAQKYPVIAFEHPGDDSIWKFLFGEGNE